MPVAPEHVVTFGLLHEYRRKRRSAKLADLSTVARVNFSISVLPSSRIRVTFTAPVLRVPILGSILLWAVVPVNSEPPVEVIDVFLEGPPGDPNCTSLILTTTEGKTGGSYRVQIRQVEVA